MSDSSGKSKENGDEPKPENSNANPNEEKGDNDDNDDGDKGPGETDLVIRDGFPALRIPGTKWKPMVDGDEPIPRHDFWSAPDAITYHDLESIQQDCETVFTARDKPDGQSYSAGQTFFLPAEMKPRCALEGLVQLIFQKHVEHLKEGTYNPKQSGAEWWTLVLDVEDEKKKSGKEGEEEEDDENEVGIHFDADYELEEQASNMLLHPRLATVTYLSNYGAPTVVFNQKSPPMDDIEKKTLEKGIDKAWMSHPQVGRHTAFDGRLLHGAPALYFPPTHNSKQQQGDEQEAKRRKIEKKRYTLLVNIWLNHWVLDAALLDEEVCSKLQTPWEREGGNLKGDDSYQPPFEWNDKTDLTAPVQATKVKLKASNVDPAGEDEIALCNHTVTVKYNPLMSECHNASEAGPVVELELEEGTITLHVGDELAEASDDEQGEEKGEE